MPRKEAVTAYLEDDQLTDIRALSKARRVPVATLIRGAVQDLLDANRAEIPAQQPNENQLGIDFRSHADKGSGGFHQ